MKNFLILILSFFFVLPAFAGNLLQQQDELKFIQEVANDPIPTNYGKDYLIREDYYGYWAGKDSLYGEIVNTLEDLSKIKNTNNDINIKYLNLIKNKIEIIVKLQNNSIDKNMRLNAARSKIIVDDTDYKNLSNDVKNLIQMVNLTMFD